MEPAIPRYDANALEARRQRAIEMLKEGKKKARVADELNVSRAAVTVWWDKYVDKGDQGIARKVRPGRPPKVQRDKIATLPILLKKGAVSYGYSTDLWTTKRVAELIKKEFGVSYDRDHVSRILHQLGLSWQRPERKALERNETAIKRWIQYRWPAIKKKPLSSMQR
jgi:transposase